MKGWCFVWCPSLWVWILESVFFVSVMGRNTGVVEEAMFP